VTAEDGEGALREALKNALKTVGLKKIKSPGAKPRGSKKERSLRKNTDVPFLNAAHIGSTLLEFSKLEYGERIAGGVLRHYGVEQERQIEWYI